jgi:hypothetical protein
MLLRFVGRALGALPVQRAGTALLLLLVPAVLLH